MCGDVVRLRRTDCARLVWGCVFPLTSAAERRPQSHVNEVPCREEESFCCTFGRARYDTDYRLPLAFPDSVVRPLGKSARYRGHGSPLQHLDSSPNLTWYQHCCCFFFLSPFPPCPSRLLNKALTAGRSPEVTAVASSVGISGMAETVAEGSSRVVRNDDGKWRRRAHRSTSSRSHSPPACRNRAIHCEGLSSTAKPFIDIARVILW